MLSYVFGIKCRFFFLKHNIHTHSTHTNSCGTPNILVFCGWVGSLYSSSFHLPTVKITKETHLMIISTIIQRKKMNTNMYQVMCQKRLIWKG